MVEKANKDAGDVAVHTDTPLRKMPPPPRVTANLSTALYYIVRLKQFNE